MNNMNICVVAGTHGNEYALGELVHNYLRDEVPGQVYPLIGNPKAVEARTRYIDSDLNRSFGGQAAGYEADRVEEIRTLFGKEGFTHVIDVHTSPTTDSIVGVLANGCVGNKTDEILNSMPKVTNLVGLPSDGVPHSLVGAHGNGGLGLECPRYAGRVIARTVAQDIISLLNGKTLPKTIRTVYVVDGKIPCEVELPGGCLRDFELIPKIGGYAFVATDEYKLAGENHQGMRASSRTHVEI